MRTSSYKSILEGTVRMAGLEVSTLAATDRLNFGEFINVALSACHEFWRWPELVQIEKRYFRDDYASGTTYAAGDEVYFPASEKYYRALVATTGNAPAALSAGDYVTDATYWWEASQEISADDWADATAYAEAATVRNPDTGLYYACHTAHTSSGSFDATKFGQIVAFRPYIAYEQTGQTAIEAVIECHDADPRSATTALKVPFRIDTDGVRFAADQTGPVWVEFRKRCPDYAWSALWSATSFASGSIVYHTTTGDVYQASSAAVAGDVPGTAALWVKLDVPYNFRHAAKLKAYALWLESDGQTEKAHLFDNNDPANPGKFQNELEEQVWQYTSLQGQTGRVNIK